MRTLTKLALMATLPLMAAASPPPAATKLDAIAARAVIDGCARHAQAKQQSHGIVVVDAGGHPLASLRMDGNGPGVMAFAGEKAKAAALWGFSTKGMVESAQNTPGFARAPYVVTVAGGVPIRAADGSLVGAIGISGEAPDDDEACATAGVEAAGFRTRRN